MQGLTERQAAVLAFIQATIAQKGYPPTLREIGVHMGIRSTNGVNDHLRALERKGRIAKSDGAKSRTIRLLGPDAQPLPVARPEWTPSAHLVLREALAQYNIIATRGGKLVQDLAGELAAALALRHVEPTPP